MSNESTHYYFNVSILSSPSVPHQNEPLPSPIISNGDYLLSTIDLREPQYALPGAAYPPSLIVSDDDYLLSARQPERAPVRLA